MRQVSRLTNQRLDTLRYIGVRPDTGLVLSGDSELVECVLFELFRQRVAGARNYILLAAVARPLRRAFHSELDDVVENLRTAIAETTKIDSTNFTKNQIKSGQWNKKITIDGYTVTHDKDAIRQCITYAKQEAYLSIRRPIVLHTSYDIAAEPTVGPAI